MPADMEELLRRAAGRPLPWDPEDVRRRVRRLRVRRLAAGAACLALLVPLAVLAVRAIPPATRVQLEAATDSYPVTTGLVGGESFEVGARQDDEGLIDLEVATADGVATVRDLAPGVDDVQVRVHAVSTGRGVVALGLAGADVSEVRLELRDGSVLRAAPVDIPLPGGRRLAAFAVAVPSSYDLATVVTLDDQGHWVRWTVPAPTGTPQGPGSGGEDSVRADGPERLVQVADGVIDEMSSPQISNDPEPRYDVEWWVEVAATPVNGRVVGRATLHYGAGDLVTGSISQDTGALLVVDLVGGSTQAPLVLAQVGDGVAEVRVERADGRVLSVPVTGRDAGFGAGFAATLVPDGGVRAVAAYDEQGRELARQDL